MQFECFYYLWDFVWFAMGWWWWWICQVSVQVPDSFMTVFNTVFVVGHIINYISDNRSNMSFLDIFVYIQMYIINYIYMYSVIHTYIHTYTHTCMCIYVYICVYMYIYIYTVPSIRTVCVPPAPAIVCWQREGKYLLWLQRIFVLLARKDNSIDVRCVHKNLLHSKWDDRLYVYIYTYTHIYAYIYCMIIYIERDR